MLRIGLVEDGDNDVGIEHTPRHLSQSFRSRSR